MDEGETLGPYLLHDAIARGGMATVHVGELIGPMGFQRVVAVKRMHAELLADDDFVAMFLDEALVASKIRHPNVVPVIDVVHSPNGLALVQEYVHGVSLHQLLKRARARGTGVPARVAVSLVAGVLDGLHGAHEAIDDVGRPMKVVHRDVSPQNVLVCDEGIAHLLDFGIAKATGCAHVTRMGLMIGKLAYMAPEQMRGDCATRAVDVYAAGVMLWEMLVGRRLHATRDETALMAAVLSGEHENVVSAAVDTSEIEVLATLNPIVMRALSAAPAERFATAEEMRRELIAAVEAATAAEVAEWALDVGREAFEARSAVMARIGERARSCSRLAIPGTTAVRRVTATRPPPAPGPAPPKPKVRGVRARTVALLVALAFAAGAAATAHGWFHDTPAPASPAR